MDIKEIEDILFDGTRQEIAELSTRAPFRSYRISGRAVTIQFGITAERLCKLSAMPNCQRFFGDARTFSPGTAPFTL